MATQKFIEPVQPPIDSSSIPSIDLQLVYEMKEKPPVEKNVVVFEYDRRRSLQKEQIEKTPEIALMSASSSEESLSSFREVLQLSPTPELQRKDTSPTPSFETSFHEAVPRQITDFTGMSKRSSVISQTTQGSKLTIVADE